MVLGKIIGHLLAKKLREKKKETGEPQTEDQEARTRRVLLEAVRDALAYKAREAHRKIIEIKENTDDPEQRRVAEKIYDYMVEVPYGYEYISGPVAAEILEKKLYKDPSQVLKLILQTHYYVLREAYKSIPGIHKATHEEHEKHGGDTIHPVAVWGGAATLLDALYYATWDKRYEEMANKIREMSKEMFARRLEVTMDPDHALREIINRHAQRIIGEPAIPEEEEREEKGEPPPPGTGILTRPDRYPALTQKVLLKALILGELQRENHGVSRDLYRALRNLLTGPETTHNYHPLILEWLERLEKGEKTSPIRIIAEKLPLPPHIKGTLLRYAKHIEEGKPIAEIPPGEKQAFKQAIEQAKQEIWRNPQRYEKAITEILTGPPPGGDHPRKTLAGILDDLAKIYTGEKTIADLDVERDALQVLRLIKNLEEKGQHLDPYQASEKIRETINQHIQDPLLRKAYNEVIDHYQATSHQIPRNQRYLEALLEKERTLEQKLKQLQHGDRTLTRSQIKRLRNLYRMLSLLTTHSTLSEMKKFYAELFKDKKIKVGDQEFLPVHGPLIPSLVEDFAELRRTSPEEYRTKAMEIASSYEPLLFIGPLLKEEVANTLARNQERTIPREEHEKFLSRLEKMHVRRPAPMRE